MKFSFEKIDELEKLKRKMLEAERERKEIIKEKQAQSRKEFFSKLYLEFLNQLQLSTESVQFDLSKMSRNESTRGLSEENKSPFFKPEYGCISFSSKLNNISALISFTEIYTFLAKCCYHLNFCFNSWIGKTNHSFSINKNDSFLNSTWDLHPVAKRGTEIIVKNFSLTFILFVLEN